MGVPAGDLSLLDHAVARELLTSTEPARLAYTWLDGTPRVVPVWFHWNGYALVVSSPPKAPKLRALRRNPEVAVSIDTAGWPYRVLSIRGVARVELLDDVAPEYAAAAERYMGAEQGRAWTDGLRGQPAGRIIIEPTWVNLLDFEERLPSALAT